MARKRIPLDILHVATAEERADFINSWKRDLAAATLEHPNIIKIFFYGWDEESLYVFMPLYEYGNMLAFFSSFAGPVPISLRMKFALDVAEGLNYVHRAGLFHRCVLLHLLYLQGIGISSLKTFLWVVVFFVC